VTLCFMCRQPIVENGDGEQHYQNRQAVEYAGEPIHRDCHPTNMPEPETDHVAVHEHLLSAERELASAVDEIKDNNPADVSDIMELQMNVKSLAGTYREEYL